MPGGGVAPFAGNAAYFQSMKNQVAKPVDPGSWFNAAVSWASNKPVLGQVLGGLNWVGQEVKPYTDAISRAIATPFAATNPNYQGGAHLGSLTDAWKSLDPSQPGGAPSPGQVIESRPGLGPSPGGVKASWLDPSGIDVSDPVVRKQAFESGGLGELSSWGTDAVIQYYADPTVLLGKAAKPLIALGRGQAVVGAGTSGGKAAFGAQKAAALGAEISEGTSARAVAAADLFNSAKAGDQVYLQNHWVIRQSSDPAGLASTLQSAAKISHDDFNTALASAMGDPIADAKLQDEFPVAERALRTESDRYGEMVAEHNLGTLDPTKHPWRSAPAALDVQKRIVDDLTARSQYLRRATGAGEGDPGIFQSMSDQTFSPIRQVNDWRSKMAALRSAGLTGADQQGYWASQTFKVVDGGPVATVMRWFGSPLPTGHVSLDGPMRTTSQAEMMRSAAQANLGADFMNKHIQAFGIAPTADEAKAAVDAYELEGTQRKMLENFPQVEVGSKEYNAIINGAHEVMRNHNEARTAALTDRANLGGFVWDEANGKYVKFANIDDRMIPLIDWNELDKALQSMDAAGDGYGLATTLDQTKNLVDSGKKLGMSVVSGVMSMWKPAVLLRVGAIPKNLGESWLASYMYLGRIPGDVLHGSLNYAQNRWYQTIANGPLNPTRFGLGGKLNTVNDAIDLHVATIKSAIDARTIAQDARLDALGDLDHMRTYPVEASEQAASEAYAQNMVATAESSIAEANRIVAQAQEALAGVYTSRGGVKPPRKMLGTTPITVGAYTGRGAAQGTRADEVMKSISSGAKNDLAQSAYNTAQAQQAWLGQRLRSGSGVVTAQPGDKDYFAHLAHFTNTNIRTNPVAMRLLAGDSVHDISDWLAKDPQGMKVARQMPDNLIGPQDEVNAYLLDLNHNLRATLPHDRLIAATLDGDINARTAQGYLAGIPTERLEPIMDDQMVRLKPAGGVVDRANRFVDLMFDKMWTMPEDRLARWPLYHQIYTMQIRNSLENYADHLDTLSQPEADAFIARLEGAAAKRAQTDVTRIIYSAGARTPIAQKLRFISTFYQVTTNRLGYYGSQFLENPQNMARMFEGWNAIGTTTDSNGRQVVTVNLPGPVAKLARIGNFPTLQFQKSSLNLINSGAPWYSPGFGPIAAVPLGEWMRRYPQKTPDWFKTMVGDNGIGLFPNNYYGKDAADLVLPSWARRLRGSEGQDFVNTQAQILAMEMMKYREGQRSTPPTDAEIVDRANHLWFFRTLAAFVLPAQPTLYTGDPNAPIPAKGQPPKAEAIASMVQLHAQYLKQYGRNGDNKFMNDHPEYYDFMISMTDNPTGVLPTNEADRRVDQYGALASTLKDPKMSAMVFNLANDYGKFEPDAYAWQQNRPITPGSGTMLRQGLDDPKQGYDNRVIAQGWQEYVKATQERDSLLKLNGLDNIRQAGAAWIKNIFDAKVNQVIKSTSWKDASGHWVTPWYDDYMTQDNALYAHRAEDLDRIVNAPGYFQANIKSQPWLASAAVYLKTRQEMVDLLAQQKAQGGSSDINASSNQWLANIWDATRKRLADSDPQWAQWQASKFAHDNLSVLPLDQSAG